MVKGNIVGEKVIETILDEMKLAYDRKKRLYNLKKDSKKFRIPDFYLEKYNLAIEYFGSWNNKDNKKMEKRERARFMEKVGAYEHSGVNCVYIYPEQLASAKKLIKDKLATIKSKEKHIEIAKTITMDQKKSITIVKKTHIRPGREVTEIVDKPARSVGPLPRRVTHRNKGDVELLKKTILFLDGIGIVLFVFLLSIGSILLIQGNPLVSDLILINEMLYSVFLGIIVLSIILAAIFAFLKDLSIGFVFVAIVLLAFFLATMFFFGDPFTRIIVILVGILAVIPSEIYMVNSN
ncbi:MAG: hypothetical protein HOE11_01160 [Candidatus Diapherotrites archaeon]|nr:hypothetical protein [Candidatus Diapherotrites archaeon]